MVPVRRLLALSSSLVLLLAGLLVLPNAALAAEGPTLTTQITQSSPTGLVISVTGDGYQPTPPGVYVALGERGLSDTSNAGAYVATSWVRDTAMSESGHFQVNLELDAATVARLDPAKNYSIYTMKAHGVPDVTQFVERPLVIDFSTLTTPPDPGDGGESEPGETEPGEGNPAPEPSVSVSRTKLSAQGSTSVTVEGRHFDPAAAVGKRPPLSGKAAGTYVVFGKFAKDWRPSTGATSASRKVVDQKWAVPSESIATIGGVDAGAVELRPDGSFTAELVIDKSAADAAATDEALVNYGIYTYPGSGAVAPSYETYTPITFEAPADDRPSLSARIVTSTPNAVKIDVTGLGYAKTPPGVYVSLGQRGVLDPNNPDAYISTNYVPDSAMAKGGSFRTTLVLDKEQIASLDPTTSYSISTMKAHGQAALDPSQTVEAPIEFDFSTLRGGSTTPGTKPKPQPGTKAPAASKSPGYLSWGVNAAFRSYVTGPIAKGSIMAGGGATAAAGGYRFAQSSTSADERGVGRTSYRGAVTFRGHNGALNLTLSSPQVVVESGSRGSLSMIVGGTRRTLATLDLGRASHAVMKGAVTFGNAPARLTAAGASAFEGFYSAGQAMDPVTFAIGAAASGGNAAMTTIAAAARTETWMPPASPPSSDGLSVTFDNPDEISAGQRFTASAAGFRPHEKGIKVVVYSTPVVLEKNLSADAHGRASWTGLLPASLEPGKHALTFQGSIARGHAFEIVKDADEPAYCTVDDASLSWGVKESFRSYISGSIANGDWKTSGNAGYTTPVFTFTHGDGGFDRDESKGEIAFDGDITFTGHNGALKVVLADPVLKMVDKDSGYLLFDTTSGDMAAAMSGDSKVQSAARTPVVELDLSGATVNVREDGTTTASGVKSTLTTQGAEVFSNYDAGTGFDPVDFTITNAADCVTATKVDAASSTPKVATKTNDSGGTSWLPWGIAALVVALGGAGALAVRLRGKTA